VQWSQVCSVKFFCGLEFNLIVDISTVVMMLMTALLSYLRLTSHGLAVILVLVQFKCCRVLS